MDPLNEIRFWSRQLSEHALFFHLGLEVEPYKAQAAALHKDWELARRALTAVDSDVEATAIVSGPVTNLRDYQVETMSVLETRWLGWLAPLFWDHTLRELHYFTARAWYGGWPAGTTLASNLRFMREHAEFAAQLLDPSQENLIGGADLLVQQFQNLERGCCAAVIAPAMLAMSRKAGEQLDAYLRTQPVSAPSRGVVHPVLADHVVREGQRYLQTLTELGG